MKGLFLKDCYYTWHVFKILLAIEIFMCFVGCYTDSLSVILFSIPFMGSAAPVYLLGGEVASKWNIYEGTLPLSRAKIVSVKFLDILVLNAVNLLLLLGTMAVLVPFGHRVSLPTADVLILILYVVPVAESALAYPFLYRFGPLVGRIIYTVAAMLLTILFVDMIGEGVFETFQGGRLITVGLVVAVCVFALSWIISIKIYEKMEI